MAIETYGVAFSLCVSLVDRTNRPQFKAAPTIAAGDFKVSTAGGALTNLATLPDVYPAGSKSVRIRLSAGEMTGETVTVIGSDAAGAEWDDILISLTPEPVKREASVESISSVRPKKNTGLDNFMFPMFDSTSKNPKTGLTVTAERAIDGNPFSACSNAVVELSNGVYRLSLSASDLNGNKVMFRFTALGADDQLVEIITQD